MSLTDTILTRTERALEEARAEVERLRGLLADAERHAQERHRERGRDRQAIEIERLREALRVARNLADNTRAALAGAPSERIIHLARVPFRALCGADKRDQTTIESDDPSDTTCQSCRDRALAERVREACAKYAEERVRGHLACAAGIRYLDLAALLEKL